jgi:hypothetical protein
MTRTSGLTGGLNPLPLEASPALLGMADSSNYQEVLECPLLYGPPSLAEGQAALCLSNLIQEG